MQPINDYLIQIPTFLIIGLLLAWWAHSKKVFALAHNPDFDPQNQHPVYKQVKWFHVVTGFVALLFVQVFLLGLILLIFPVFASDATNIGLCVIILNVVLMLFLMMYLKSEGLQGIYYKNKKYIKLGFLTLFLALPWVFLATSLAKLLVVELLDLPPVEQNPITFLQSFSVDSIVFYGLSLLIFTIIPINEEILFRGLFQNYITKFFKKDVAMIATPILFTLVHYQFGQGLSNIELLTPLFVLAVFLSYLYAKTGSLIATIIFHSTFNFLSILFLILEKLTTAFSTPTT
jgi:membrane protease YdiL (CAAX protease family)